MDNRKVYALISCMHQTDCSIICRSNVQCNVVVVNQCDCNAIDRFTFRNIYGEERQAIFICTTERGLSRSRNMAIRNAPANSICVVCDDDETLESNIEETLINAYNLHKGAVAITFSLIRKDRNKKYPDAGKQIGFKDCLRTNSLQITFLRDEIILRHISFDINMGSGTGNGGGEENKFLLDIRRSGGKMFYTPIPIATVNPNANGSQWFKGYTSQFFINLGWTSRRLMGFFLGHVYIIYFLITHYKLYKNDMSFFKAFKYMLTGVYKRVKQ